MEISLGTISFLIDVSLREGLMLLFLIGITVGSFFLMKRMRKDRVIKLGNYKTLKEVKGSRSLDSIVILAGKIIVVCLLFLAATESIQIEKQQPVTDTEYVVVMDSSQSMLIPDYEPDRLGYIKKRLIRWVRQMPVRARLSVVEFSSEPKVKVLPTKSNEDVIEGIQSVEVDLSKSGTNIYGALNRSIQLSGEAEDRRILVLTDGSDMTTQQINRSIQLARNTSAEIYFFDVPRNNRTEQLYTQLNLSIAEENIGGGIKTEDNSFALRRIAEITEGDYYTVDDRRFFKAALNDTNTREERVGIDSSFYILIFISFFVIFEMLLYSRYGAL
jgi:hypothetical protein